MIRRISVFEVEGRWTFAPGAESRTDWETALGAANAAVVFGDSLRQSTKGFEIRLLLPTPAASDREHVVLHTHMFSPGAPTRFVG